jgi:predicted O-methyltransferase YrrM
MMNGRRKENPWWPLSVIPIIENHLDSHKDVIEFGSGGSTIWLAGRANRVVSMEDNLEWHSKVTSRLIALGYTNAEVRHSTGADYYNLDFVRGKSFDLAVIDGSYRWKCIESVQPLMKSGGIIYLDNSDSDKDYRFYPDPQMRMQAQRQLEQYAKNHPGSHLERHVGLISGEIQAGEGMILRVA